ncbi:hypothetical protein AAHC03_09999 [Spirometra sp. Aus1]
MNNKTPEVGSDTTAINLCKRGYDFYGSGQFKDMWSKCYQEYIKNDIAAQSSIGSHNKNVPETSALPPDLANRPSLLKDLDLLNPASPRLCPSGKRKLESNTSANPCFQCRYDGLFCALHRYSNQHDCSFDYRQQGKMEIARDNPEVRCAKIRKI